MPTHLIKSRNLLIMDVLLKIDWAMVGAWRFDGTLCFVFAKNGKSETSRRQAAIPRRSQEFIT